MRAHTIRGCTANTKLISVYDKNDKHLGYERIDDRADRRQIVRLLNTKNPWEWEYYE
jgi:hypothetical protein